MNMCLISKRKAGQGNLPGFVYMRMLLPEVDTALVGAQSIGGGVGVIAQGHFRAVQVETLGSFETGVFVAEGADNQNLLTAVLPGIDIEPSRIFLRTEKL